MGAPPSSIPSFEQRLDEALLDSGSLQPRQQSVRTLLEILRQQPFLPAYAASASSGTSDIQEHLLELSSAHQTRLFVKILQVSSTQAAPTPRTSSHPMYIFEGITLVPSQCSEGPWYEHIMDVPTCRFLQ